MHCVSELMCVCEKCIKNYVFCVTQENMVSAFENRVHCESWVIVRAGDIIYVCMNWVTCDR